MSSELEGGDEADPLAVARRIAVTKLATRAHSVGELRTALMRKNVPTDLIEQLLTRFGEVGLLDDAEFAEQWVSSRYQHRHASRATLRRELKAKGVGDDEIEAALRPVDAEAELAAAEQVAAKKLRSMRGLDTQTAKRRLAGALARRGFSSGIIADVVRRSVDAVDDVLATADEIDIAMPDCI